MLTPHTTLPLDMLILQTISNERTYASTIAQRLSSLSGGALATSPGPLLAILQRLASNGWITIESGFVPACLLTERGLHQVQRYSQALSMMGRR